MLCVHQFTMDTDNSSTEISEDDDANYSSKRSLRARTVTARQNLPERRVSKRKIPASAKSPKMENSGTKRVHSKNQIEKEEQPKKTRKMSNKSKNLKMSISVTIEDQSLVEQWGKLKSDKNFKEDIDVAKFLLTRYVEFEF